MSYKPAFLFVGPLLAAVVASLGCTRQVSFEQDVRPVLREKCVGCHKEGGVGYIQSGLNLDNYDGLMKGTKFGPVIKPGSSVDSTLVILIEHKAHSTINMPRGQDPLPDNQVNLIKQWVDQGAKNN
jgi:hypothetical protein